MLDKIKSAVSAISPLYDQKGIFLSGFDSFSKLVASQGAIWSDRSLETLIESIYSQTFASKASNLEFFVVDIVTGYEEINDTNLNLLTNSDPKLYGFGFQDPVTKIATGILPDTAGVGNIGQIIQALRVKANSTNPKGDICRFTTTRFVVKK